MKTNIFAKFSGKNCLCVNCDCEKYIAYPILQFWFTLQCTSNISCEQSRVFNNHSRFYSKRSVSLLLVQIPNRGPIFVPLPLVPKQLVPSPFILPAGHWHIPQSLGVYFYFLETLFHINKIVNAAPLCVIP